MVSDRRSPGHIFKGMDETKIELCGRLRFENLIALGQRDPGLLAPGPEMRCGPQPGGIVQSARTHAAHSIPRHAANPGATHRANQSGVYAPTIGGAL